MKNFEKEKMKAEINSEMVGDAMDMGEENEEADDVYNSILGEIGMSLDDPSSVAIVSLSSDLWNISWDCYWFIAS